MGHSAKVWKAASRINTLLAKILDPPGGLNLQANSYSAFHLREVHYPTRPIGHPPLSKVGRIH